VSSELAGVFVNRNMMLTPKNYHFIVGRCWKTFSALGYRLWDFAIVLVLKAIQAKVFYL
jgi:hypothetical protein